MSREEYVSRSSKHDGGVRGAGRAAASVVYSELSIKIEALGIASPLGEKEADDG